MSKEKLFPAALAKPNGIKPAALQIALPKSLIDRIDREKAASRQRHEQVEANYNTTVQTLLEGFLAGFESANGKFFNLSDDGLTLIEKTE